MNTYVKLVFLTDKGNEVTVTVPNVKEEIDSTQTSAAMTAMINSNAIASKLGNLTQKKATYLYKVTETPFLVK